jgi:hypothetical protein
MWLLSPHSAVAAAPRAPTDARGDHARPPPRIDEVQKTGSQFSSRPNLVPSVTVVLFRFSDRWERGEGRLAKPGAGLIQPLRRRDGHGRPG